MTAHLYYEDPYGTEFDATIVRTVPGKGGLTGVVLDRTCFYPASGGQPHDLGTLGGLPVQDVLESGEGIVHWVQGQLSGPTVHGQIDWARRFDHMQQHSGQHILSGAFLKELGADTVSFHLGAETVTIDLDRAPLEPVQAQAVEDLANEIVFHNRPITARIVDKAEIGNLDLRKLPSVEHDIRIVEVEGFDRSPCGGTHCTRTGEVGPIAIRKWERRGQETRVEFVCGWRAVRDYRWKTYAVNELALAFSVKDAELTGAVLRLMQEAADSRRELHRLQEEWLASEADRLLASAQVRGEAHVIVHAYHNVDPQQVRNLALTLSKGQKTIALLGSVPPINARPTTSSAQGPGGQAARLFFARTADVEVDLANLLKRTCQAMGGSGGGQPHLAQGGGLLAERLEEALRWADEALQDAVR